MGLAILVGFESSNLDLLLFWASIALITQIPLVCLLYYYVQKNMILKVEIARIVKFALVAMVIFGFTYYLTEQFLVYSDNIFSFIPNIIMFASLSIGLYFIITYLIDKKIRNLVNAVIYEIKTRVS